MSAYISLVELHDSKNRKVLHMHIRANKFYRENQREDRYRPICKYENTTEKKNPKISEIFKKQKAIKHKTKEEKLV
jgi:hypothetical protein